MDRHLEMAILLEERDHPSHHLGTGSDLWIELANSQPVVSDVQWEYTVYISPRPRMISGTR
jgi:hypothetical protein